jgi:autotransporter translocation and assembly factor TamB
VIGALVSRLLSAVQALLLAVVVLCLWLFATSTGSGWLINAVAAQTDGVLSISGLQGSLLRGLRADRIEIRVTRTRVVISAAEVAVFWPDLLRSRVRLSTARAGNVLVEVGPRPTDEPDTPVMPLLLPVVIATDSLEVGQVQIRIEDGEPFSLQAARLQGELAEGTIHFDTLALQLAGMELSATGSFGTGEPFASTAELRWSVPGQALSGQGPLRGDLEALRFEQVVRMPDPVGVGGVLRLLADEPEVIAGVRWQNISRQLGAAGTLVSDRGQLQLRGWTQRYTVQLEAGLALGAWSQMQLSVAGNGDMQRFIVDSLRLGGPEGTVAGKGLFNYMAGLRGAFDLRGRGIDPRPLDARLAGKIDFDARLGFDADGNFSFQLHEAKGRLFERLFRASGMVTSADVGYAFDELQVQAGANRLDIDGIWGPALSGRFSIDAPDLATLWPGLAGYLRGSGTISGTAAQPGFQLALDGEELAMGTLRIDGLRARGGLGARNALELNLTAAGIVASGQALGDLDVVASGALDAHSPAHRALGRRDHRRTRSQRDAEGRRAPRRLQAGFRDVARCAALARCRSPGGAASGGYQISAWHAHCWGSCDGAELCLSDSVVRSAGYWAAGSASQRDFPLASLATWLGDAVELAGNRRRSSSTSVSMDAESDVAGCRPALQDAAFIYRAAGGGEDDISVPISEFMPGGRASPS